MITVDVDTDSVVAGLNDLATTIQSNSIVREPIDQYLVTVQRTAQRVHRYHRRSGKLERSVKIETNPQGGSVYIDDGLAPYGAYVHDGFKTWSSDPFVQDAADRSLRELDDGVDRAVDSAIQKAGLS